MKNKNNKFKPNLAIALSVAICAIWLYLLQSGDYNTKGIWADISKVQKTCTGIALPFPASWLANNSFEQKDMWIWVNSCEDNDYNFNWHINSWDTDTLWTWPSIASDGNYYLFTESSKFTEDNLEIYNNQFLKYPVEAILLSPIMDFDDKVINLSFDYNVYWKTSDGIDQIEKQKTSFSVSARDKSDKTTWETKFNVTKTKSETDSSGRIRTWFKWEVSLNSNKYDQLQFKVVAGSWLSDIAIDNVNLEVSDNVKPDYDPAKQDEAICLFENAEGVSLLSENDLNLIVQQINNLKLSSDIVAKADGVNHNILFKKKSPSVEISLDSSRSNWQSCSGGDLSEDWVLNKYDVLILESAISQWPLSLTGNVTDVLTTQELLSAADIAPLWNPNWRINQEDLDLLDSLAAWGFGPLCADFKQPVSQSAPSIDCWFENEYCNWTTENFRKHSGRTTSDNTWPTNAFHWTGYAYLETSIKKFEPTLWARDTYDDIAQATLTSPSISVLTNLKISFSYHMYWSEVDTLEVQVSKDGWNTWTTEYSLTWNKWDNWLTHKLDLTSYQLTNIIIRFKANSKTGNSSYRGDIAIDNIIVSY